MRRHVASSGRARGGGARSHGIPSGRIALPRGLPEVFLERQRYEGLAFHKIVTCVGDSVRFSSKIGEPAIESKPFIPSSRLFFAPPPRPAGRRGRWRRAHFEPALGCRSVEARSTPQGSRPPRPTCAVAAS